MLNRIIAAIALSTLITNPGCAMSPRSKASTVVAGVATTAVGFLLISAGKSENASAIDSCHSNDGELCGLSGDGFGSVLIGTPLVLAGGLAILAGIAAPTVEPAPPLETAQPQPVMLQRPSDPITTADPQRDAWLTRPLPEVATDASTIRMAKQARSAAVAGMCTSALTSLERIARQDPGYHNALLASHVLDGCL